jgi:hypothetical protein
MLSTGDSLAQALHTIQEEDEDGLAESVSLSASLSDFSLTSSMHRHLTGSPALRQSSGDADNRASQRAAARLALQSPPQGGRADLLSGMSSVPSRLGGLAAAGFSDEDLLGSLTHGTLQQGPLLVASGAGAAGGTTGYGGSDQQGPLSVTSSMGSDDFSSIMSRLLSDITQSLASAAPVSSYSMPASPGAAATAGRTAAGPVAAAGMSSAGSSSSGPLTSSAGTLSSLGGSDTGQ